MARLRRPPGRGVPEKGRDVIDETARGLERAHRERPDDEQARRAFERHLERTGEAENIRRALIRAIDTRQHCYHRVGESTHPAPPGHPWLMGPMSELARLITDQMRQSVERDINEAILEGDVAVPQGEATPDPFEGVLVVANQPDAQGDIYTPEVLRGAAEQFNRGEGVIVAPGIDFVPRSFEEIRDETPGLIARSRSTTRTEATPLGCWDCLCCHCGGSAAWPRPRDPIEASLYETDLPCLYFPADHTRLRVPHEMVVVGYTREGGPCRGTRDA